MCYTYSINVVSVTSISHKSFFSIFTCNTSHFTCSNNKHHMMTSEVENRIGELDNSIIALSKRKLKLLKEVEQINLTISFLRKQQEDLINV